MLRSSLIANIILLLCLVLVVYFASLAKCCERLATCENMVYVTKTDTIHATKTIHTDSIFYQRVHDTVFKVDSIIEYQVNPIDTAAIINNYFDVVAAQTHFQDSLIDLTIFDTLSMNRIIGRSIQYSSIHKQTIIQPTKKPLLKGGFLALGNTNTLQSVAIGLQIDYKQFTVGAAVGTNNHWIASLYLPINYAAKK